MTGRLADLIAIICLAAALIFASLPTEAQQPPTLESDRLAATEAQRNTAASEGAVWFARYAEAMRKIEALEKAAKECKPKADAK